MGDGLDFVLDTALGVAAGLAVGRFAPGSGNRYRGRQRPWDTTSTFVVGVPWLRTEWEVELE
jgi:hypothetical protein